MATNRTKPLYRYRVTRLGFHFLFVALFAILGGALRGFNLLLLLAGLLISIMLIQWRHGRHAIRRTRVRRREVSGMFAGAAGAIHYDVGNVGRWIPLWNMQIEDRVLTKTQSDATPSIPDPGQNQPVVLVGSVGNVPAGQTRGTAILCRFHQRGTYTLGPVIVSTTFPFSLMSCQRQSRDTIGEIDVYPRLLMLRRGWKALLPPRRGGDGNRSTGGTSHDGEFFGLRPWQSGDHVKHIHWRTTARIGQPAVRQFEQRNRNHLCVVVDAVEMSHGEDDAVDMELVLEVAATFLVELATATRSIALVLADCGVTDGGRPPEIKQSVGIDVTPLLRLLAIAVPHRSSPSQPDPLAQCVAELSPILRTYDLLVVSGRSMQDAIRACRPGGQTDRAVALWRHFVQTDRLSWCNVNSPELRRYLDTEPHRRGRGGLDMEAVHEHR